ncbi:MAG: hypothetical protein EBU46_07510 [Nitrosomonadaceae bacterium]|nr:hypothetical protein [Nitrosomonadaceae bacterium]
MHTLLKAKRLEHIAQRIGFALWQIQELEGVAAQFFVLVAKAEVGMGQEKANALVEEAQNKTFGATVNKLIKGNHLPSELNARFSALLLERNWLVHNSRASSRSAIYHQPDYEQLITKVDSIADESLSLLKELSKQSEIYLLKIGITTEKLQSITEQTLQQWHASRD